MAIERKSCQIKSRTNYNLKCEDDLATLVDIVTMRGERVCSPILHVSDAMNVCRTIELAFGIKSGNEIKRNKSKPHEATRFLFAVFSPIPYLDFENSRCLDDTATK